jgi:hypothetical protein
VPKEKAAVAGGEAAHMETVVSVLATRLKEKRDDMLKAIGKRPYQGLPIPKRESLNRYAQIRHSAEALTQLFKENAKFKVDGRVLFPKKLIKDIIDMERTIRIGESEEEAEIV